MPSTTDAPPAYDAKFFSYHHDNSERSAQVILPLVVSLLSRFSSVLDVGCGDGAWLLEAARLGATRADGVDGSWALESLRIPRDRFSVADLSQPWRAADRPGYDLVCSLEVAEHLPAAAADDFVDTLVAHGDVVLFSAATPGQGGTGHVNEQWPRYWAERFASRGYVVVDCIRPSVWEVEDVAWWYRQNAVMYVRREALRSHPRLANLYDAGLSHPRAYIHPGWLLEREGLARRLAARPWPRRLVSAIRGALRAP